MCSIYFIGLPAPMHRFPIEIKCVDRQIRQIVFVIIQRNAILALMSSCMRRVDSLAECCSHCPSLAPHYRQDARACVRVSCGCVRARAILWYEPKRTNHRKQTRKSHPAS